MKSLHRRPFFRTVNQKISRANELKNQVLKNYNLIDKIDKFAFTYSKIEKQFAREYHHWGAKKKVMDIIIKWGKMPATVWLIEKCQEMIKPGDLRFNFDSNFNRKVWVPRRPDKRGRDEVAVIDVEILFRNQEKNRWCGGYFEFKEPRASTSTMRNRQESSENVSSTEESEVARPTGSFFIVDLKDYDIVEKSIHYMQVNHMIEKPKFENTEAEENLQKAKFNFMVHLKTLIHKTSVDPNLLLMKVFQRNNQKERAPRRILSGFQRTHWTIWSTISRKQNCKTRGVKEQVVDALRFGHPESTKVLAKSYIFCWAGVRKDIEEKCSTCTACMTSGKHLKCQIPLCNTNATDFDHCQLRR